MMLEVTGERLARRCLDASSGDEQTLWGATLADFLPEQPIGWPCWAEIEAISDSIPVSILTSPGATAEKFTAMLYRRIEQRSLDAKRCGEVVCFFRGFCRAFFHRPAGASTLAEQSTDSGSGPAALVKQSAAASERPDPPPHDLPSPESGLLNFNDLLAMLLDWCSTDDPDPHPDPPPPTWTADELVPLLVRLIEAMDKEERLAPELLLGSFSSDRCVLRRKRLSYAAGLDLETVDVLMTILSSLSRFHRSDPLAFAGAEQT